jgi:hypothetical protein
MGRILVRCMRRITVFIVLFTLTASVRADDNTDRKLARLMVGIWRSPRHTYVYAADGRWWNADSYSSLDKPEGARGRWKIENHELVTDHENVSFGGFYGLTRYRITKLTRDEVVFDGYRMKRWTREDVKNW